MEVVFNVRFAILSILVFIVIGMRTHHCFLNYLFKQERLESLKCHLSH